MMSVESGQMMKTCDGLYDSSNSVQSRPNTSITLSVVVWVGVIAVLYVSFLFL